MPRHADLLAARFSKKAVFMISPHSLAFWIKQKMMVNIAISKKNLHCVVRQRGTKGWTQTKADYRNGEALVRHSCQITPPHLLTRPLSVEPSLNATYPRVTEEVVGFTPLG